MKNKYEFAIFECKQQIKVIEIKYCIDVVHSVPFSKVTVKQQNRRRFHCKLSSNCQNPELRVKRKQRGHFATNYSSRRSSLCENGLQTSQQEWKQTKKNVLIPSSLLNVDRLTIFLHSVFVRR